MALSIKNDDVDRLARELRALRKRCSRLPVLDQRSPDEILGYDERGLPR